MITIVLMMMRVLMTVLRIFVVMVMCRSPLVSNVIMEVFVVTIPINSVPEIRNAYGVRILRELQ